MRKKITLQEIAKNLGLSVATVSRALNNKGRISQEIRRKVLLKAQEMGYITGLSRRFLISGREGSTVAVVFPESDFFWRDVERGVNYAVSQVKRQGIKVELYRTDGHNITQQVEHFERFLKQKDLSGVVFVPADTTQLDYYINALFLKGVAVATFNTDAPLSKRLLYVGQNVNQAGRVAGELFLKSLGHKAEGKILILSSNKKAPSHVGRWQGLIDFVHGKNLRFDVSRVFEANDEERAYQLIKEQLEKENYLGIFVTTAFGNLGAARAVEEHNDRELVFIGNDVTDEWISYLKSGVIDYCLFQEPCLQGYLAIRMLVEHLFYQIDLKCKTLYFPIIPIFKECIGDRFISVGEQLIEGLSQKCEAEEVLML